MPRSIDVSGGHSPLLSPAACLPALERDCQQAVSLVLQGVQTRSPETVLRGLKDLEQRFETLRDTRNALLQDLKSAQDMCNLRQTVFCAAIESLDVKQCESIRTRPVGNDVIDLREAIYSLGERASVERHPELGVVLSRMGAYLEELAASAPSLMGESTTALEQAPSRDVQQAFTATFGIRWDANGTAVFND